ncbi:MAG: polysaccharide pyruvyl transferase family protein [Candidatus Desantisbacteria bacterium]
MKDCNSPLFVLAGNGPYDNRGCEAIVRGTVEILREYFNDPRFVVASVFHDRNQFHSQCFGETNNAITHISINTAKRYNFTWQLRQINRILHLQNIAFYPYKNMDLPVKEAIAVLSIGGDNYSLSYSKPDLYLALDDFVLKRNSPLIIWGASVGPFDKDPDFEAKIIPHLKNINGIFARESLTVEYLAERGVIDNVYRVADPAVLMKPIKPKDDKIPFQILKESIGINLSPLMARYVTNGNMDELKATASEFISKILNKTDRQVVLVPHVIHSQSNDYNFLKEIEKSIKKYRGRVFVLPPTLSAAETKWAIAQMKIFAGARTHSTIAALSSCVPTLSFAYSVKAFGINKDFYGHTEYCLNPEELNSDIILSKILELIQNHNEIQAKLQENLPKIQEMAMQAGLFLREILKT